jgi:DNA-binding CsgD family transcriptional regulator
VQRSGASDKLIGRRRELEMLVQVVSGGTGPRIALIGGEAGVGKSRLLAEVTAGLGPDVIAIGATLTPSSSGRPFDLVQSALEGHVRAWTELPSDLQGRPDAASALIAPVAPLIEVGDPVGRDEMERAAVELLCHVARPGPAVLAVEDLHWADDESLTVLDQFALRLDAVPLRVVATFRPAEVAGHHPVAEWLRRIERRHHVAHVRLAPFTPAELAEFLRAATGREAPRQVVEQLHGRTGGNPFFVEQLLAAAGDHDLTALLAGPLPLSLSETVQAQLGDLTAGTRQIADAAAVLGQLVEFDLLAAVTGAGEDDLIVGLRELVAAGVLVEPEPDVFWFRHDLVRETLLDGLLGRQRRRLHERALAALDAAGIDDDARRVSYAAGAGWRDELVLLARNGARRALERGSTWTAFRLALEGLSVAPDDLDLLEMNARAAWLAGFRAEGMAAAERWEEVAQDNRDSGAEAAALRLQARLCWEQGDSAAEAVVIDRLVALVDDLDPGVERARVLAQIAQHHMLAGQAEAVEWAQRALAESDEHDAKDVRAQAMVEMGTAYLCLADHVLEGGDMLRLAADEAEASGDWVTVTRAIYNLVGMGWHQGLDAASTHERIAYAIERAGFDSVRHEPGEVLVSLATNQARRADALAALPAPELGSGWGTEYAVLLHLEVGDTDAAELWLEHMPSDPCTAKEQGWQAALQARVLAQRGDVVGATVALLRACNGRPQHWAVPMALRDLVMAGAGPSQLGEIAEAFRPATDAAGGAVDAALIHGWWHEVSGRPGEAARMWRSALDLALPITPSFMLAEAQLGLATALWRLGRQDQAADHLVDGLAALELWSGSRRDAGLALQRAMDDGVDPADWDPVAAVRLSGSESRGTAETASAEEDLVARLTPRERDVAALVAEGCTNAQVAQRLGIATKTAAIHVSNILAKLAMGSRTEVASWWIRREDG